MRSALILLASAAGFLGLEIFLFHSHRYPSVISPDSSTGFFEMFFQNERHRQLIGPQILGMGDSRMALTPRLANALRGETGYTFGNAAVPGATPRVWYYSLRDLDPQRDRYSAIVFGMDNYDDFGSLEDLTDRQLDTRLVAARLRMSDVLDYSSHFRTWETRWVAARSIVFKGSLWSTDFQFFLHNPAERIRITKDSHARSWQWNYDYVAPVHTMVGVNVDYKARTLTVPPTHTEEQRQNYIRWLLRALPEDDGSMLAYNREWLGRIYDLYRNSKTRLIFFRLPRAPFPRPDYPAAHPHSALRDLATQPNVTLIDEHLLDSLERPEYFLDEMHLNIEGVQRLTPLVAREVVKIVGPPR